MTDARTHYRTGNELRAQGHDDEAIKHYARAVELDPSLWLARKSLSFLLSFKEKKHISFGNLYESEGKWREAIAEYKKALDIKPTWRLYHKIALLYKTKGSYDHALIAIQKAIAIAPTVPELYVTQALLYDAQGTYAEAIASYKEAQKLFPHHKESTFQLKLTQTIQHILEKQSLFHSPATTLEIAEIFIQKGLKEKALSLIQKAIKRFPEHQELYLFLGNLYYGQNKFKLSYRAYRKALQTTGTSPLEEIHYNLGLSLAAQERWKEALFAWETCIRLAPRSNAALRAKANLSIIHNKLL